MGNLEKELLELQSEVAEIPNNVLKKINLAFDEIRNNDGVKEENKNIKNNKNRHINRKYVATAAGLAIVAIIGITTPVRATIEQLIFSFKNPGIENAVKNNYIQNISDREISTDKFDMKLKNVLVDPSHIALDFEIVLKDSSIISLRNFKNIDVYSSISLYNENSNVIKKDGEVGPIGSLEYIVDHSNLDNKILGLKVLFGSSTATIPNISKLNINIEDLTFRSVIADKIVSSTDLNWNISVDLDSKFTNYNTIDYSFVNDCPNIVVNKVKALPTGMFIDFDYLVPGHNENIMLHTKLIDENGKEYRITSFSMEGLGNGGDNLKGVFEGLTSFDSSDSFTLEIENPDGITIDKVHFKR